MITEVTCSGCRQVVPWPASGVSTSVTWLREDGSLRGVEMRNLENGRVFHRCPVVDGGRKRGPTFPWAWPEVMTLSILRKYEGL